MKNMSSGMSTFCSQVNPITGKQEWVVQSEDYDYQQEVARSAYADMLHDEERNKKYYIALRKAIDTMHRRGKQANVLDIGTGTGLLSMMAARCGADTVTACEAFTPMAQCARQIIKDNGFADKIQLIPKRSTQVTVGPDGDMKVRANILVTEVYDTELIGEGAIGTFHHAHKALLQKDCIVVPTLANMYVQVVQSDFSKCHNRLQPIKVPDCDDITPPDDVRKCPGAAAVHDIQMDQLSHDQFKPITEPVKLFRFDYSGKSEIKFSDQTSETLIALRGGSCDAIYMWWDLQMDVDGDVMVSCAPRWSHPEPNNMQWRDHWMQAVYYPPSEVSVAKGDEITIHGSHDDYSLWFDVSKEPEDKGATLPPTCTCGAHVLYSRSRIAMLNDRHRNSQYVTAMKQMVTSSSVCLCFGDGSLLPVIAARLGAKQVYVLETKRVARRLLESYISHNKLGSTVTVLDKTPDQVTSQDLGNQKIDVILAEPYFSNSILPWHNLYMWYAMKDLTNHITTNTSVLPSKVTIKAIGVQFTDLWKIRAPVGNCEGFDISCFDKLIEDASNLADANVEPQPLWEYPSIPLTSVVDLLTFDLTSSVTEQKGQTLTTTIDFTSDGTCNGVALWVDYTLTADRPAVTITTGLVEPPSDGSQLKWDACTRQGVHLVKPCSVEKKTSQLTIISTFKPDSGNIDFIFAVKSNSTDS